MAKKNDSEEKAQINESLERFIEKSKYKTFEEAINSALQKIINSTNDPKEGDDIDSD